MVNDNAMPVQWQCQIKCLIMNDHVMILISDFMILLFLQNSSIKKMPEWHLCEINYQMEQQLAPAQWLKQASATD